MLIEESGDDSDHGRNEADNKVKKDASINGFCLLIYITGYYAEHCSTEHHGRS